MDDVAISMYVENEHAVALVTIMYLLVIDPLFSRQELLVEYLFFPVMERICAPRTLTGIAKPYNK